MAGGHDGRSDRRVRTMHRGQRALATFIGVVLLSGIAAVATYPEADLTVAGAIGDRANEIPRWREAEAPAASSIAGDLPTPQAPPGDEQGPVRGARWPVADLGRVDLIESPAARGGSTGRTDPSPTTPSSRTGGHAPPATDATSSTSVPGEGLPMDPDDPSSVAGSGEQGRWWADHNGYHAEITMEPARPKAGDLVTFRYEVSHERYPCCGYSMTSGDGHAACRHHHCEPSWFDAPGYDYENGCGEPIGGSATLTWQHTYNRPGRWVGQFTAHSTPVCGGPESTPELNVQVWIEVAEGRPPSAQGPKLPFGDFNYTGVRYQEDGSYFYDLYLEARDEDGDPRRFDIDWGDGSPIEVVDVDDDHCPVRASGWTDMSITAIVPHRYTLSPRPPITVTVTSTGCDGSEPQRGRLEDRTGEG